MIYVVGQIWIWLLVALALGIAIGWLWTRLSVGGRLQEQLAPWRDRVSVLERERDQLRRELGEVRDRATESETKLAALREGREPAAPPVLEVVEAEPRANGPLAVDEGLTVADTEPAAEAMAEPDPQPDPSTPEPVGPELPAPEPPAPASASFEPAPADVAADSLTSIKGIGKALEARLNGLGITTYAQIAALTETDIRRIDDALGFRGRVTRDRWIAQAQALIDGQRADGAA